MLNTQSFKRCNIYSGQFNSHPQMSRQKPYVHCGRVFKYVDQIRLDYIRLDRLYSIPQRGNSLFRTAQDATSTGKESDKNKLNRKIHRKYKIFTKNKQVSGQVLELNSLMAVGTNDLRQRSFLHVGCKSLLLKELNSRFFTNVQ